MELGKLRSLIPRVDTAGGAVRLLFLIASPYLFWIYSNKFLGLSAEYIAKMSRSIEIKDQITGEYVQANAAYFPLDDLVIYYGGFILFLFILVQNEFGGLSKLVRNTLRLPSYFLGTDIGPIEEGMTGSTNQAMDPITGKPLSQYREIVMANGGQLRWSLHLLSGVTNTIFALVAFVSCFYLVTEVFELTPAKQVPFFFVGGAFLSGLLLLQDNIPQVLSSFSRPILRLIPSSTDDSEESAESVRADRINPITGVKVSEYEGEYDKGWPQSLSASLRDSILRPEGFGILVSVAAILAFPFLTLNTVLFPFVFDDIAASISLMTLLTFFIWGYIISQEGSNPAKQSKRMAAFAFLALFPIFSYLFLRVVILMNDGSDPVMLNRWSLDFAFMESGNTFEINPWPIEVQPNVDSRWVFLKAAVINSARVTLVSIVLCTLGGIIVGVSRLSSNRFASGAATVYVELFRNLPLAVLLFLISVQMGQDLPLFREESTILETTRTEDATIAGAFISKQGVWFVDFASYEFVLYGIIILALTRAGLRFFDRVEPREESLPNTPYEHVNRPFSSLGWRFEPLAGDIAIIASTLVFMGAAIPFISASAGGDSQTLSQIIGDLRYPFYSLILMIYCFSINSNVDSAGMNNIEMDDSDEGLRKRFTVWTLSFAVALGIALSGGLSWPELTKDFDNDGIINPPGGWTIIDGAGFEMTPAFLAMMLGLTLFTTAVVAEIVRGSIQSLPRGQVEAAISLSLNPFQRLRLVILPQALRSMVPLLNSQYMNVWKNSSLAIVVGYTDVFYNIVIMMNNVGKLIPLFVLLLVTYQVGSLSISLVMNWYNSKVTSVKI